MTKLKTFKCTQGLSMIELMVSITIIMVGLLGFVQMTLVMSKGNQTSRASNEGVILLQNTIEDMGAVAWDDLGTDTALPADYGLENGDVRTLGPLDRNGEDSSTGEGPFRYMQHVVVCSSADSTTAGSNPNPCAPTFTNVTLPEELSCSGLGLNAREKMVRVMLTWTSRSGRCSSRHSDSLMYQ